MLVAPLFRLSLSEQGEDVLFAEPALFVGTDLEVAELPLYSPIVERYTTYAE